MRRMAVITSSLLVLAVTAASPAHANNFKPDGTYPHDVDTVDILTFVGEELVTPDAQQNVQIPPRTAIEFSLYVRADQAPAEATTVNVTLTFRPYDPRNKRKTWRITLTNKGNACADDSPCQFFWDYFSVTPTETGTWVLAYDGWPTVTDPQYASESVEILKPSPRATVDAPDAKAGYQVHVVYVVPSDAQDVKRDTRGEIGNWLDQGTSLLERGFGRHWNWDTRKDGKYDISFHRSSFTSEQLQPDPSTVDKLASEYTPMRQFTGNRKTYLFIVETDTKNEYCGMALAINSRAAMVVTGPDMALTDSNSACGGSMSDMRLPTFQSKTIVHEILHTVGVEHVNDKQDLMCGSPFPCDDPYTNLYVDPDQKYYNGTSLRGLDVQKLRIWSGNPSDSKQHWTCASGESALVAQSIVVCSGGASELPFATFQPSTPCFSSSRFGTLEILSKGKWKSVGKLTNYPLDYCASNVNGTTNSLRATVKGRAGTSGTYRFHLDRWTSPKFTVVFQN